MTTLTSATAASSQKNGCTSGFLKPVEQARELLGASWKEDLEAHLLHGVVMSTPTSFVMGRPVPMGAEVYGPWKQWEPGACDAWFIWIGVGPVRELFALMPRPLPWLGWMRLQRDWGDIHWIRTEDFRKRLARV